MEHGHLKAQLVGADFACPTGTDRDDIQRMSIRTTVLHCLEHYLGIASTTIKLYSYQMLQRKSNGGIASTKAS